MRALLALAALAAVTPAAALVRVPLQKRPLSARPAPLVARWSDALQSKLRDPHAVDLINFMDAQARGVCRDEGPLGLWTHKRASSRSYCASRHAAAFRACRQPPESQRTRVDDRGSPRR